MDRDIIVVKMGSQTILQQNGSLDLPQLNKLVNQIVSLERLGYRVVLVSSGAVAAGRDLHKDLSECEDLIQQRQVLASLGQAVLIQQYNTLLKFYDYTAAQILLTKQDLISRTHRRNVLRALDGILKLQACLPIINENDTTAIEELMFTDNDELSALVAILIKAKYLVVLTNVDGVFDKNPFEADAKMIHHLNTDHELFKQNHVANSTNENGRGGILNKIHACKKAAHFGIHAFIANARCPDILIRLIHQQEHILGTKVIVDALLQDNQGNDVAEFEMEPAIIIDTQSSKGLGNKNDRINILPENIQHVDGSFAKGEVVVIKGQQGQRLGIGITEYGSKSLAANLELKKERCFIRANKIYLF